MRMRWLDHHADSSGHKFDKTQGIIKKNKGRNLNSSQFFDCKKLDLNIAEPNSELKQQQQLSSIVYITSTHFNGAFWFIFIV